jgi:uncharacterized protein (DUF433 family)
VQHGPADLLRGRRYEVVGDREPLRAPGTVGRDGPAGRRAGLAAGPDVWEIISAVRSSGLEGESAVAAAADWMALTTAQVRFAVGYYAEYPDEIDERIRLNIEEADAGEERWRREQNALA